MPPHPKPLFRVVSSEAKGIVKAVLKEQQNPVKIHDLYKLALQKPSTLKLPPPKPVGPTGHTEPPNDHVIRSMSYLKRVVLPELVKQGEVEQIHTKITLSAEELEQRLRSMTKTQRKMATQKSEELIFAWRLKSKQTPPMPKPTPTVFGTEVGVGEDWSHLNKRRQHSRNASVIRDVAWVKELNKARSAPPPRVQ